MILRQIGLMVLKSAAAVLTVYVRGVRAENQEDSAMLLAVIDHKRLVQRVSC